MHHLQKFVNYSFENGIRVYSISRTHTKCVTLLSPCLHKLLEKAFLGQLEKLIDGLESR